MQYLWQFYLLIVVIFLQGLLLNSRTKQGKLLFIGLCFIELAFLSGFRDWNIGNDTRNYINAFILSIDYPQLLKSHMEVGYLYLNRFLAFFTSDPQMLLLTTSVFIVGVWLYTFYKYSVVVNFSTLLFVILEYSVVLTMIRQEISTCIILLAIPFILRRQLLAFLIMVCLAMSIHSSAILGLGLYFIYPVAFKKQYVISLLIGTLVAFILLAPMLDQVISLAGRYDGYIGNRLLGEETKTASVVKTFVQFSIMGFLLFSYKYILPKSSDIPSRIPLSFLLWCSFIASCLQFISIRGTVLERLVLYFSAFNFISVPYFVYCYPKKLRISVAFALVFCFVLYKSVVFVYRPEWNSVLPFKFCF